MGTSASFARKAVACLAAALLTLALVPASALAQGEAEQPQDAIDPQAGETQEAGPDQDDAGSGSNPAASPTEGGTLASALVGAPTAFINSDVALDSEPVVGSFTVDGLTFAVTEGSDVELVGVSSGRQQVTSFQKGDGSPVAPMLASGPDGSDADSSALALPGSITYEGVDYAVTSIGAYAFYLSGVASVELPASVADVDDRAFRSSDVASVEVADGNPSYSFFDGALYSADYSSLLLIPEGKQGTVLLPKRAEVADAGKFSHCSLASAISVEEDSAAFASENGLLYTSDLTTLLRVPAGATDITIRDGCTTIAAGALEACASLETITAPASVISISPDVFTSVPTVSLPVVSAVVGDPVDTVQADEAEGAFGSEVPTSPQPPSASSAEASGTTSTQLTAMVALSSTDDDLPEVVASSIAVAAPDDASCRVWEKASFAVVRIDGEDEHGFATSASLDNASSMFAAPSNGAGQGWIGPVDRLYCLTPEGYSSTWTGEPYRMNPVGGYTKVQLRLYNGRVYQMFDGKQSCLYQAGINSSCTGVTKLEYTLDGKSYTEVPASSSYTSLIDWTSSGKRMYFVFNGARPASHFSFDSCGGDKSPENVPALYGSSLPSVADSIPYRAGYRFLGWFTSPSGGEQYYDADGQSTLGTWDGVQDDKTLYAQWERVDFDLGFDVDSEPGDEDYPGVEKPDETVNVESGPTIIEDPKRPGYVFQGWVIPSTDGTEAIDQDLVYRDESDGKWYVDASKLPDYANDEGRVELTARWTSVISVDVPSAVTFYADVVTQGNESREGAASSAFGQNKVASQSEVDLRIVGLESTAVATQGSTLGADSILKKSDAATPSSSTQKLFSLYPTDKALAPDDLQDPDAVSAKKPADAVDFALDDLLLEKSFAADAFTIPAGDTLNLGYRLNLVETGTELDYDTLSTLDEGQSASIANISYCFATDGLVPTGSKSDPLWFENTMPDWGPLGVYGLSDIKAAAEYLSANADKARPISEGGDAQWQAQDARYILYRSLLDNPDTCPVYMRVDDTVAVGVNGKTSEGCYPLQVLGICQDVMASDDSQRAGLSFGFRNCYALRPMNPSSANCATNGWAYPQPLRTWLQDDFAGLLDERLLDPSTGIVAVKKGQQRGSGSTVDYLQTSDETIFIPSMYEVSGLIDAYNNAEGTNPLRFQYQFFAKGGQNVITNTYARKSYQGAACDWYLRSAFRGFNYCFCRIDVNGSRGGYTDNAVVSRGILPCFAM